MPQGTVLSPTLFNFLVSNIPSLESSITSFADDITIYHQSTDITTSEAALNRDLVTISSWLNSIDLKLSPSKSSVTLFSPSTHEFKYHPQVIVDGTLIPLDKNPRALV